MGKISESGVKLLLNEPMSRHTTLGIGGPARQYAEIFSAAQFAEILKRSIDGHTPLFVLGAGSNLLVKDNGFNGIVVRLKGDFESIQFERTEVIAGAGVFLPTLVKTCADQGLGGMEPLVGVPGTVGGALVMNAGTRELEIGQLVQSADCLETDGTVRTIPRRDIEFTYRSSSLTEKWICSARLKLHPGERAEIQRNIQQFLAYRLKTQPVASQNVGSVFRNPPGNFAGQLIEKAGLKGLRIGNAQVSEKHANFIINLGGAAAHDFLTLVTQIQQTVKEKFNIMLEPEFKVLGE